MHRVEEMHQMVAVTEIVHHFYCDECGKHIGSSVEDRDGCYDERGEIGLQMCFDSCWYKLSKCLCEKCRENFIKKTMTTLAAMGFTLLEVTT